jgi:hypothetical protein
MVTASLASVIEADIFAPQALGTKLDLNTVFLLNLVSQKHTSIGVRRALLALAGVIKA